MKVALIQTPGSIAYRRMRKTFTCDDTMIITIPIGRFQNASADQLVPDKFHCVFRDSYKVFVEKGKPRPFGAAEAMAGVFLFALGFVLESFKLNSFNLNSFKLNLIYTLPSVLFVISGLLTYAAGKYPNMHVTKLSFSLNIISFFWSVVAFGLCLKDLDETSKQIIIGLQAVIMSLLVVENILTLILIYWLSKAVCKQSFNSLPTILLKHND